MIIRLKRLTFGSACFVPYRFLRTGVILSSNLFQTITYQKDIACLSIARSRNGDKNKSYWSDVIAKIITKGSKWRANQISQIHTYSSMRHTFPSQFFSFSASSRIRDWNSQSSWTHRTGATISPHHLRHHADISISCQYHLRSITLKEQ